MIVGADIVVGGIAVVATVDIDDHSSMAFSSIFSP